MTLEFNLDDPRGFKAATMAINSSLLNLALWDIQELTCKMRKVQEEGATNYDIDTFISDIFDIINREYIPE
jgi:hypothetical protein